MCIRDRDYYVWEKVCQFIDSERSQGRNAAPISVNVSRVNLYNPDFMDSLIDLIHRYHIPPHYLNLELTESVFSEDAEMIQRAVNYLHEDVYKRQTYEYLNSRLPGTGDRVTTLD